MYQIWSAAPPTYMAVIATEVPYASTRFNRSLYRKSTKSVHWFSRKSVADRHRIANLVYNIKYGLHIVYKSVKRSEVLHLAQRSLC